MFIGCQVLYVYHFVSFVQKVELYSFYKKIKWIEVELKK